MLVDGGGGFWSNVALDIQAAQRDLHRQLAAAMEAVQRQGATAAGALVVLSFLYGVFHAAGPGHGKVVISTYLMTQESQLRRGVVLSMLVVPT
jgi:nickel/cobalt exporter